MNKCTTAAVVGLILLLAGFNWNRGTRDKGAPVPLSEPPGVWVQLGHGFPEPGVVRHYIDGITLSGVIELTTYRLPTSVSLQSLAKDRIVSGRRIDLIVQGVEIQSISVSWMTASQRATLGIPLHPDKMTQLDWEFLPGIGEKMAAKIESDRQENGDFGSLEGLLRVKGIGSSKIKLWKEFF